VPPGVLCTTALESPRTGFGGDTVARFGYGGQAVIEGVMMRGPASWAVAVRRPDETVVVDRHPRASAVHRHAWLRLPVLRGVAVLWEALVLGVKAGVGAEILYDALSGGSGDSFVLRNHFRNHVLKGKFEEGVFPVEYMLKDLDLALSAGTRLQVPLHFVALAAQQYILAGAAGESKRYHPAVIRPLERLAGVEVRSEK